MTKPLITSTNKPLPFRDLSPLEFERLCLWLVEREGYLRPQHLGEAGSEQGRDVVAHKPTDAGEELWYFQCKRYKRIGAATLKKEVDKYKTLAEADPTKRPVGVVFVTNAVVSANVRDDVAAYCQKHGYAYDFWARTELDMLVKKYPDIVREFFSAGPEPFQPAHLFICYKRSVGPDRKLAAYLYEFLTAQSHDVFIDSTMRTGEAWLEEIDRQIKASDFLIVLLSKESADSEMVQAEVRRAYEYRKLQGRPHILTQVELFSLAVCRSNRMLDDHYAIYGDVPPWLTYRHWEQFVDWTTATSGRKLPICPISGGVLAHCFGPDWPDVMISQPGDVPLAIRHMWRSACSESVLSDRLLAYYNPLGNHLGNVI